MIFLIVLLFIVCDAYFNHWRIHRTVRLNHYFNVAYRLAFYGSLVWAYKMDFAHAAMFLLGSFFLSWIVFNALLNGLEGKSIDYLGKTSVLDRWESKLPWSVTTIWKVILTSGFIYGFYNVDLL